jgi:hypothetical protein
MKKSDEKKGKSDKVKHNGQQEGQSFMQPKVADNPFLGGANQKATNPFGTVQMKSNHDNQSNVLAEMGKSFGTDFSDVKIHTNSQKASKIGAHAFAQGNDVHFAQGKFDPNTKTGKQLIGHELSHVVQQRNGEVKPNVQMKGLGINTDDRLENEADKQGALAAEGKAVQTKPVSSSSVKSEGAPVQGFFGNLIKKGLNFLKSTVVDMIPQEFKDMIPEPLRNMASEMADRGIEAAGSMAEQGGQMLAEKAKSKLATLVPPQMREMVDKIPPDVRQYLEGILEKGGQLAKGALDEGALPSGDQLKQFGKDAAVGGIDLGKKVIPDMIPQDIKDMASKLPPEIQDFAKEKFEQGAEGLKDAVNTGQMPDLKQVASNVANEAKDVAVSTGTRIATEKATEILQGLPSNVMTAIDSLPANVKDIIMSLLPSNVKKEEEKPAAEEPKPEEKAKEVVEAVKEDPAVTPEPEPATPEPTPEVKPEPAAPTPKPKPAGKRIPGYMRSTASSRAKQTTKRAGSSSIRRRRK